MSATKTSYTGCARALARARAALGAAECHGLLCGMLCGTDDEAPQRWLEQVLGSRGAGAKFREECRAELLDVLVDTVRRLCSNHFDFTPLLPDDTEALGVRSEALANWCSGFLYGIGTTGSSLEERLSRDAREVLADFSEVTRLRADPEESDSSEADYIEIVEYLRVGVMLIFEELRGHASSEAPATRLH
jgi:yecA family protein